MRYVASTLRATLGLAIAIVSGLLTFALSAWALRPYSAMPMFRELSAPEVLVAAGLAVAVTIVVACRLARGESIRSMLRRLKEALSSSESGDLACYRFR